MLAKICDILFVAYKRRVLLHGLRAFKTEINISSNVNRELSIVLRNANYLALGL